MPGGSIKEKYDVHTNHRSAKVPSLWAHSHTNDNENVPKRVEEATNDNGGTHWSPIYDEHFLARGKDPNLELPPEPHPMTLEFLGGLGGEGVLTAHVDNAKDRNNSTSIKVHPDPSNEDFEDACYAPFYPLENVAVDIPFAVVKG